MCRWTGSTTSTAIRSASSRSTSKVTNRPCSTARSRRSGAVGRACWGKSTSHSHLAGSRGAKATFHALGYRGYYVRHGRLELIDTFSVEQLQDPTNLPDLTAPLQQRQRFGRYIYNFIFLPRDEPVETLRHLSDRLGEL